MRPSTRERLGDVTGHADGAAGVGQGPTDALADPPRRVGREREALAVVERLDRPQQPEVALLHEVAEREPGAAVAAGHPDDEAQVGPHEAVAGVLALGDDAAAQPAALVGVGEPAGGEAARRRRTPARMRRGEVVLLVGGQQGDRTHLVEVPTDVGGVLADAAPCHRAPLPGRGGTVPRRGRRYRRARRRPGMVAATGAARVRVPARGALHARRWRTRRATRSSRSATASGSCRCAPRPPAGCRRRGPRPSAPRSTGACAPPTAATSPTPTSAAPRTRCALAAATGAVGAVLKARSPSCGCHEVYDGTFTRTRVDGRGRDRGGAAARRRRRRRRGRRRRRPVALVRRSSLVGEARPARGCRRRRRTSRRCGRGGP